jgi:hypothetical protein
MVAALLKDTGIYVSDGIVSSYSYLLYYPELKKVLDELSEKYQIQIVLQTAAQIDMPPTYVAGIIIVRNGFDWSKGPKLKDGYAKIPYSDFEDQKLAKKQMAWTYLFRAITEYNLEMPHGEIRIDIERIAPELVDQLIEQIVAEFGASLFRMATNGTNSRLKQKLASLMKNITKKLEMYSSLVL